MKVSKYYVGASLVCLFAGFGIIHLSNVSGTAEDSPRSSDAKIESNLSVGTVLMWWGSRDAVPSGWEICDGQQAKTPGATLSGKKPDLTDRFPKGASSTRKNIGDLSQAVGGSNNMPALQIAKIDGLKISEDGEHSHQSLDLAAVKAGQIDQADNKESSEVPVTRKGNVVYDRIAGNNRKLAKADAADDKASAEGKHSHKLSGFIGSEGGINADGNDKTGANQPAFSELFFIIRVK